MKLIDSKGKEVEIKNQYWPLVADLFAKWEINISNKDIVEVINVDDITPELSAWGIPWSRKWSDGYGHLE